MNPTTGYDADSIQTLEGLEAVRKRPGMYIGGTGSDGLMHLVWELIDNAVDEASGGHANRIDVTLHRDRTIEVADNGRGIPIDLHAKRKVSALEVVFTELHAGGKFGGGAYGSSGGLHGVGASVVNALSAKLVAEVDRNGATWRLAFNERVAGRFDGSKFTKTHELEKVKSISKKKTGTRIRFLARPRDLRSRGRHRLRDDLRTGHPGLLSRPRTAHHRHRQAGGRRQRSVRVRLAWRSRRSRRRGVDRRSRHQDHPSQRHRHLRGEGAGATAR